MLKGKIYALLYYLQEEKTKYILIPLFFYITNCLIDSAIFLALPLFALVEFDNIFSSIQVLAALYIAISPLLLSFFLYFFTLKDFLINLQIFMYRYVISPFLSLSILCNARAKNIPMALGLLLFIANILLSSLFSELVCYCRKKSVSLQKQKTAIMYKFNMYENILIISLFMETGPTMFLLALIPFVTVVYTYFEHFHNSNYETFEFKILYCINILNFLKSIFFILKQMLLFSPTDRYVILSLPIIFIYLWLVMKEKVYVSTSFVSVLTNYTNYDEFISNTDYLLNEFQSDNIKKTQLQKNLISVLVHHHNECKDMNCDLLSFKSFQELQSLEHGSIEKIKKKIEKKIETIYQEFINKDSANKDMLFSYLKFQYVYRCNKAKMLHIIHKLQILELTALEQFNVYKYRLKAGELTEEEDKVILQREPEVLLSFEKSIINVLGLMVQFWFQFKEETVDLAKLKKIAIRLYPAIRLIQAIVQQHIQKEQYVSFQILSLYQIYLSTIGKNEEMANKMQELLKRMMILLRQTENINYISDKTQSGIIMISILQSKLGEILLANNALSSLFKYNKAEMIGQNINLLIPSNYIAEHDKILLNLTKKNHFSINSSKRLLFAKNASQHLVPIQLKLQNVNTHVVKDLTYLVADIKYDKQVEAPAFCMLNNEYDIIQHSSAFEYFFYKKRNHRNRQLSNIQQYIPSFLQDNLQNSEEKRVYNVDLKLKTIGLKSLTFNCGPIKVNNTRIGFLIQVKIHKVKMNHNKLMRSYSQSFTELIQSKKTPLSYQNSYLPQSNIFQMNEVNRRLKVKESFQANQQIDKIFGLTIALPKAYSQGIKTIRLNNKRYEAIAEQQSFHTELDEDQEKNDVNKNILEIKQKSDKNDDIYIVSWLKMVSAILIGLIVGLLLVKNAYLSEWRASQNRQMVRYEAGLYVLQHLSEYIVCFTYLQHTMAEELMKERLVQLELQVFQSLEVSLFDQIQKEIFLKVFFSRNASLIEQLIAHKTFQLSLDLVNSTSIQSLHKILWYLILTLFILLAATLAALLLRLYNQLSKVYNLFIILNQNDIRSLENNCQSLINQIAKKNIMATIDSVRNRQQNEDDENEFRKMKKYKNQNAKYNLHYFTKILLPLFVIIFTIVCMMVINPMQIQKYQSLKLDHTRIIRTVPEMSLQFMIKILKTVGNATTNLSSDYWIDHQTIQSNIINFFDILSSSHPPNFIYSNICTSQYLKTSSQIESCIELGNGILKTGLSSTINYIAIHLKNMKQGSQLNSDLLLTLYKLQFMFLIPVLQQFNHLMDDSLMEQLQKMNGISSKIIIMIVIISIFYLVYLLLFLSEELHREISINNSVVKLTPKRYNPKSQTINNNSLL